MQLDDEQRRLLVDGWVGEPVAAEAQTHLVALGAGALDAVDRQRGLHTGFGHHRGLITGRGRGSCMPVPERHSPRRRAIPFSVSP
jgi:hypothetical protein